MTSYGLPLKVTVRPTMSGAAPKARRQKASVSRTTRSRPSFSSSSRKFRPIAGGRPSASRKPGDTASVRMRSGSPVPVRFVAPSLNAAIAANDVASRRQSKKSAGDTAPYMRPSRGRCSASDMIRSASAYGRGRQRTASTTLKIAVLAPMPRASAATATSVNDGWRRSMRRLNATSRRRESHQPAAGRSFSPRGGRPRPCTTRSQRNATARRRAVAHAQTVARSRPSRRARAAHSSSMSPATGSRKSAGRSRSTSVQFMRARLPVPSRATPARGGCPAAP